MMSLLHHCIGHESTIKLYNFNKPLYTLFFITTVLLTTVCIHVLFHVIYFNCEKLQDVYM